MTPFFLRNRDSLSGVYLIRCLINGRFYVGSSGDIRVRLLKHLAKLRRKVHENLRLQSAFTKYGADGFEFFVVEETGDLLQREQFWIDELRAVALGFNVATEAVKPPSWVGRKHSLETRRKISLLRRGMRFSPEHRARLSEVRTGRKKSPQAKANHLAAMRRPEVRARNAAARKGKPIPLATRRKMSDANKGKPWSDARWAAQERMGVA